ncbi:hypothetical protein IQ266_24400 [filamentous cyanobacterium LEGE 11480]|uniref:Uncharacterized protein n=1 Tax=Romeriopsis navalis LEGE 11480 TaxID=2777977 RepID=A0A928Z6C3_9CYAN|nr:hypothetical protein [Romeriopsis navalis]MBE9032882.1 hypothetical protein [Romeriopsis navalis LEGE 11480]
MTASAFSPDTAIEQLKQVRMGLLRLHKALLDAEKITYEQANGRIANNMEFFGLVLNHEWFQWLRPMSGLIAEVDEAVGNKKSPITADIAVRYLEQVTQLVAVHPTDKGNALKYYEAIERDPNVAQLHVTLTQILQGETD